ncbi:hypothetical protein SO694_00018149 [Aureococcus anophagefferens]|uniref:Uncharacterized protein n=1 Tax=Aureococcus anophagefferens TaxID=44056 RepID=A0ABR1G0C5_AURAN|nr:hypothetical protein JL720_10652 [Aureococcus anophagefferens]
MLSKSDVLDAIDLKIDYIGAAASVEEHGITLIPVNKYMLCAEELLDLPQSEWWPFTHCAFEIQKCMNYVSREEAGMTSCDEADSGSDDAMALAGTERDLSTCTCTLEGVVEYCAETHTSTTLAKLATCKDSDEASKLFKTSNAVADAINSGHPLWVKINGVEYAGPSDPDETTATMDAWAEQVLNVTCQSLGSAVSSCAPYV